MAGNMLADLGNAVSAVLNRVKVEDADRQGPNGRIRSRQSARAAREKNRRLFGASRRAEFRFRRQLKAVAKQVAMVVSGMAPGGIVEDPSAIRAALAAYAEALEPWAEAVSAQMVREVAQRDATAWDATGKAIGRGLRREIESAPIGEAMRQKMAESVALIKSLPLEAGQRVHKLVIEGMGSGERAAAAAEEIRRTGEVTESRAMLIARTEIGRASTALVHARAEHIGSTHYTWETAGDVDVRESHKKMQGQVVAWDDPPTLDGLTGHAGALPNCRCWPRPIIPDDL